MRPGEPVFCCLLIFLAITEITKGQMFSVQNRERDGRAVPQRKAYIGIAPAEFDFRSGGDDSQTDERFNFDAFLVEMRYEIRNLNLFLNFGNGLTGADSVNYFNFGVEFFQPLPLVNKENFQTAAPLLFRFDFTNVNNEDVSRGQGQFQQNNLEIGTGLMLAYQLSPFVRFSAQAVPSAGISFSAGSTFFGTTYGVESSSRLYFDRLFDDMGLSFGYQFRFRRYDIDVDLFDYDLRANTFSVGLTF